MVSLRTIATAFAGVALFVQSSIAHSIKRNPIGYASLIDSAVIKAPSHRVNAHSHFDLTFTIHSGQEHVRLKLEPNHDLLPETFAVTHLDADGNVHTVEPVDRSEHKVFKGEAFVRRPGHEGWFHAGWARITIHRDGKMPIFEGSFRLHGDNHHIQIGSHFQRLRHEDDPLLNFPGDVEEAMVMWRDSDIVTYENEFGELKRGIYGESSCQSHNLEFNARFNQQRLRARSLNSVSPRTLFGRQSIDDGSTGNNGAGTDLEATIGSVDGCPTTRKVALVGIATDCTYTAAFNSSESVRKNIISLVNSASQIYESTFNISLGIQNLTISNESCPGTPPASAAWNKACSGSVTLADRLSLFSAWRGNFEDTNAYWTLLTTCNTDSAVGLAWLGQLCRNGSSENSGSSGNNGTVASANVVVRTSAEWQVFAHESGHTFGAVHDCTSDTCPVSSGTQDCCPLSTSTCNAGGKYIMNPSTGNGISDFSACSIGNICSGFKLNVESSCLTNNRDVETITGSQCGNGIVESGEDCDCGGSSGCADNICCDADTCKFKDNAKCDPTNEDCCTDSCQFANNGTVCRESSGECDPEETCSGKSASCPSDSHMKDGDSCGDGLSCASGQCTSRDLQCRNMFGNSSSSTTEACGDSGCLMTCDAPEYGYGTCVELNQNFLDGTSCGGGGRCSNGSCKGGSTWQQIIDWFKRNKNIAIPVGSVIGALILLSLISCCYTCIRRRVSRRRAPKPTEMNSWPAMARGANGNYPHPNGPPPGYDYAPLNNSRLQRGRSMRYA
ncbi:Metallo-peptidase family M12-domain-containing protein [Dactylonectria macrodidyma]|uniref:Disintegrin and metalloproteinase domain-containing protein B n=1 Tax=Dactylonectria macrodidyma TaxID=307937 RepID=A0A9P9FAE5_9HYPO|nr:Metallo-peptidase family M12-domain-containing protein [Dactylonectria macrodidyma]